MATLRPVPETPPRAVLYLRQSVSRDDSISLELQEAAGRDYCNRQGYTVIAVEADPGISGRTWKRPAVQRVMSMVDDGDADVIVLWKWSRLSRSRRDWAVAVDRVDVAGGRIESATEQVDVSTATGRLARGVLAEFSAFESDRIGEVWKEVQASRLADGYAPNGKPRFGYRWDAEQKLHVPDPETGPVLAEAYRRYVAGESVHSLVRWLNSIGVTTTSGGPWADRALRRVLDAGFAAGIIQWRGEPHPGKHDRLIEHDLWKAYQDARVARRRTPARVQRSQYLLSGLVRCGRCQGSMVANNPSDGRRAPSFRCRNAKEFGPERCAGGYVAMHLVEEHVVQWLREFADDVEGAERRARSQLARRVDAEAEQARLAKRVTAIDQALTRLTRQLAEGLVPESAYRAARDGYVVERDELVVRLEEHGRAARATVEDPRAVAAGLLAEWEEYTPAGRREILSRLFSHVEVVTTRAAGGVGRGGVSQAQIGVVER